MAIAYGQDFEAEASKLGLLLVDSASTHFLLRGEWRSGEIFAEDGPGGVGVAIGGVTANELELCWSPVSIV